MEEKPKLTEILKHLTKDQLRFIVALQEYPTKDAAAKAIGVKPATVYDWPPEVDEAARLLALDTLESARELRRRNLVKAMGVKAAGLDSKSEAIRQKAASEIIEWELGQAEQKQSGEVKVIFEYSDTTSDSTQPADTNQENGEA